MIFDDETKISKPLIKTEIDIRSKNNLKLKKQQKNQQKTIQKTDNKTKPTRCSSFYF